MPHFCISFSMSYPDFSVPMSFLINLLQIHSAKCQHIPNKPYIKLPNDNTPLLRAFNQFFIILAKDNICLILPAGLFLTC